MKFFVSALSLVMSLAVTANPVPDFPFVIVTEKLEQEVKPDVVKVRFSILTYEQSSNRAMEQLTKFSALMLEALKKHGVPTSSLESTQIDKNTKRARKDGAYNLEVLGYEVQQGFNLRLTNLDKYPSLMNELIRLDGVQNIDAFFETSKEEEYKEKMITELSAKARKKANALAQAQSREVKSVYGITTEENFGHAYAIFSLEYNPQEYALPMAADSYGMDLVMAVPEYIKVGQRITAIYELN
ncbi:SIMPL domain-containing protein [Microbulbifer sp. OS29]|uniref:SIMPL domain-containing protein n=1 Tax=Microbulbifer okhotskensis TaxID=2926617 RepID=A0A9X2ERZ7_9GAMM|nr:SIMPL domain-containing protein [Microbulbifer okhotskensis]MCO1336729.1 SIMPL domain-containing protein [Microbulbifer okhotskensis]